MGRIKDVPQPNGIPDGVTPPTNEGRYHPNKSVTTVISKLFSPDHVKNFSSPTFREAFSADTTSLLIEFHERTPHAFPLLVTRLIHDIGESKDRSILQVAPFVLSKALDVEKPDPELLLISFTEALPKKIDDLDLMKAHALNTTGQILAPHLPPTPATIEQIRDAVEPIKTWALDQSDGYRVIHGFDQMIHIMSRPIITKFQDEHPDMEASYQLILEGKWAGWKDSYIARRLGISVEDVGERIDWLVTEGYLEKQSEQDDFTNLIKIVDKFGFDPISLREQLLDHITSKVKDQDTDAIAQLIATTIALIPHLPLNQTTLREITEAFKPSIDKGHAQSFDELEIKIIEAILNDFDEKVPPNKSYPTSHSVRRDMLRRVLEDTDVDFAAVASETGIHLETVRKNFIVLGNLGYLEKRGRKRISAVTPRQGQILNLLQQTSSITEIGAVLGISAKAVSNELSRLRGKEVTIPPYHY